MNRAQRRRAEPGRGAHSIEAATLTNGGVRVMLLDDAAHPISSIALDRGQAQRFSDSLSLVLAAGGPNIDGEAGR